jgi:uncharacterized damage-inducible protein DinB
MLSTDHKDVLTDYLQTAREAMLWKLEGLSEYDVRRPMTRTATNLLGLVKHLIGVESEYFGVCFGRPFPEQLPWYAEGAAEDDDMWARPSESREYIVGLYRRAWAHADATIAETDLDTKATVPWWFEGRQDPTLARLLVHVVAETNRHAGHADILRETIDGAAGHRAGVSNLPERDEDGWVAFVEKVERAAGEAARA